MFIQIDNEYLDSLRKYEKRIPFQEYGQGHFKPFFQVFRIQNTEMSYVSQISHPKARTKDLPEHEDIVKLKNAQGEIIGVVNLNHMFPVFSDKIIEYNENMIREQYEPKSDEEIDKMIEQFRQYKNEIDTEFVSDKAIMLYQLKSEEPEHSVAGRTLNFKELEAKAVEYQLNDYLDFGYENQKLQIHRDRERFVIKNEDGYHKTIGYRHLQSTNMQNLLVELRLEIELDMIHIDLSK